MRRNPDDIVPYEVAFPRPDGNRLGSPKLEGTKDILALTDIYAHNLQKYKNDKPSYVDASGFYLILWDDGQISEIPYDQVLYVRQEKVGYVRVFLNQAGVTSRNSLTYSEFWSKDRAENLPPLGKPIPKGKDEPVPDNGGPESLVQLSRLMGAPDFYGFEREKIWQNLDPAQPEFSLAEIQTVANKLELPTQVKKATLDELVNFGAPAILFLSDDKRQVALAALSDKYALVVDRGITRVVARDLLAQRYSGEALIPQVALDKPAALRAENGLQQITVGDIKQEIPIQAVLKNSGAAPLNLQIEQPIPGCLKAQLSAETIAPGAQVTLNATLKWREVMKTTAQNVIIWVKSNDAARPRLPIAIRLALPKPNTP